MLSLSREPSLISSLLPTFGRLFNVDLTVEEGAQMADFTVIAFSKSNPLQEAMAEAMKTTVTVADSTTLKPPQEATPEESGMTVPEDDDTETTVVRSTPQQGAMPEATNARVLVVDSKETDVTTRNAPQEAMQETRATTVPVANSTATDVTTWNLPQETTQEATYATVLVDDCTETTVATQTPREAMPEAMTTTATVVDSTETDATTWTLPQEAYTMVPVVHSLEADVETWNLPREATPEAAYVTVPGVYSTVADDETWNLPEEVTPEATYNTVPVVHSLDADVATWNLPQEAAPVAQASQLAELRCSWNDEANDGPEAAKDAAATADDKVTAELNVGGLTINDDEPVDLFDPDDSIIQAVSAGDTPYASASRFEDLGLSAELLKGLYVTMRFERPSKIQAITLPMILTPPHKNLIAQAHNGSGKTTCFVLGMLSRVDPNLQAPQALCICPTRELALQNLEVLKKMGRHSNITSEAAVQESLDNPAHVPMSKRPPIITQVIVGTPGTIKRWISYKKLSLIYMKILVYDEADHMLAQDGFRDDSLRIMNEIKRSGADSQVLLFSATFNDTVKNFIARTINDYNQLFVRKEELSLEAVKHYKVDCPDELAKVNVIKDRILDLGEKVGQTIIFVRTRNSATMLHNALVNFGFEVTTIQGARSNEERDLIVKEFKDGLTHVLISTDLLARGFDQSQVNLIVNYELPTKYYSRTEPDHEVYLHRVGRAGRFGRKGAVFNLLCDDRERLLMQEIEQHFRIKVSQVGSWDSDEDFKAALKEAKLL
ncbi:hypothetical protein Nepgr_030588 [Nepenthes gracilis]|uniref:RNA helicase n=1 Tax=Nepenthes gracilis TaxID=150966 RepID=A0AAD3TEW0_NEPGR|nr:hypothetical protein Nepgr_030588 [Nepenthes gracilis]